MKGWVYVVTHKGHPGLVKIGYTERTPELRVREMNGTGSPYPHLVEYAALVEGPFDVEQRTHKSLGHLRVGEQLPSGAGKDGTGVEWFNCSIEEAVSTIKFNSGPAFINEAYKGEEREAIKLAVQRRVADLTKTRAKVAAKEKREREIDAQERKINHSYLEKFDAITRTPYWPYFLVGFVISASLADAFMKKPTTTVGVMMGLFGAWVFAAFFHQRAHQKKQSSPAYLEAIKARDKEIAQLRSPEKTKAPQSIAAQMTPPSTVKPESRNFSEKPTTRIAELHETRTLANHGDAVAQARLGLALADGSARELNGIIHIRPIHLAAGAGAVDEPDSPSRFHAHID